MFNSLAKTPEFDSCVSRLATLVNSDWKEEVRISEDTAYDFDFLFTILKYIKKVREAPVSGGKGEKGEQPAKIPPSLSKSVTLAPVLPRPASDASSVEHSSEES